MCIGRIDEFSLKNLHCVDASPLWGRDKRCGAKAFSGLEDDVKSHVSKADKVHTRSCFVYQLSCDAKNTKKRSSINQLPTLRTFPLFFSFPALVSFPSPPTWKHLLTRLSLPFGLDQV